MHGDITFSFRKLHHCHTSLIYLVMEDYNKPLDIIIKSSNEIFQNATTISSAYTQMIKDNKNLLCNISSTYKIFGW